MKLALGTFLSRHGKTSEIFHVAVPENSESGVRLFLKCHLQSKENMQIDRGADVQEQDFNLTSNENVNHTSNISIPNRTHCCCGDSTANRCLKSFENAAPTVLLHPSGEESRPRRPLDR